MNTQATTMTHEEKMNAAVLESRRHVWERVLKVLPEGATLVQSGYGEDMDVMESTHNRVALGGETLGYIRLDTNRHYYTSKTLPSTKGYQITSHRIPGRHRDGKRRYKSLESMIAGVKEFFRATTNYEKQYEEHSRLWDKVSHRVQQRIRELKVSSFDLDRALDKLASDNGATVLEGQRDMLELVAQKRRANTYARRIQPILTAMQVKKDELWRLKKNS